MFSMSPAQPKVGLITIGQSPRADMVPEMLAWLEGAEPLERGALDGLTAEEIDALRPLSGDHTLVTRLGDGSSAVIGKSHILPRMQRAIDELEAAGVSATVLLCTGEFPPFRHNKPLLPADQLLGHGVKALARGARVGVICPLPEQQEDMRQKWSDLTGEGDLHVAAGSPYGDVDGVVQAARRLAASRVEFVVLDCMGFTQAMKRRVQQEVQVPVLLARSVVARLAAEVLG